MLHRTVLIIAHVHLALETDSFQFAKKKIRFKLSAFGSSGNRALEYSIYLQ